MTTPRDRCGYTWPEDYDVEDHPDRQSCCCRETAAESDRCLLHADPGAVEADPETVVDSLEPPETGPLVLDGADLSGLELGYHVPSADEESSLDPDAMAKNPALETVFKDPEAMQDALDAHDEATDPPQHPFEGASLRGSDLSGSNFYTTRLNRADFRDATLSAGQFEEADFSGATLVGADLSGGKFRAADFSGATLVDADLSDAEFKSVDFTGADLKYADLSDTTLEGADLTDADLRDADLSNTYFSFTTVGGANLGFADLSNTTL